MSETFYTIPTKVSAVQWTGENPTEIQDFVHEHHGTVHLDALDQLFFLFEYPHPHRIQLGDWVVHDPKWHSLHVIPDDEFQLHHTKGVYTEDQLAACMSVAADVGSWQAVSGDNSVCVMGDFRHPENMVSIRFDGDYRG